MRAWVNFQEGPAHGISRSSIVCTKYKHTSAACKAGFTTDAIAVWVSWHEEEEEGETKSPIPLSKHRASRLLPQRVGPSLLNRCAHASFSPLFTCAPLTLLFRRRSSATGRTHAMDDLLCAPTSEELAPLDLTEVRHSSNMTLGKL